MGAQYTKSFINPTCTSTNEFNQGCSWLFINCFNYIFTVWVIHTPVEETQAVTGGLKSSLPWLYILFLKYTTSCSCISWGPVDETKLYSSLILSYFDSTAVA